MHILFLYFCVRESVWVNVSPHTITAFLRCLSNVRLFISTIVLLIQEARILSNTRTCLACYLGPRYRIYAPKKCVNQMKKYVFPNQITNNHFAMAVRCLINARYKAMTDTAYVIPLRTPRRGRLRGKKWQLPGRKDGRTTGECKRWKSGGMLRIIRQRQMPFGG